MAYISASFSPYNLAFKVMYNKMSKKKGFSMVFMINLKHRNWVVNTHNSVSTILNEGWYFVVHRIPYRFISCKTVMYNSQIAKRLRIHHKHTLVRRYSHAISSHSHDFTSASLSGRRGPLQCSPLNPYLLFPFQRTFFRLFSYEATEWDLCGWWLYRDLNARLNNEVCQP